MGILHNWAVYRRAQVIYGVAIVERKGLKEGVNGGKSDKVDELRAKVTLGILDVLVEY